jgi:hypothetical protein
MPNQGLITHDYTTTDSHTLPKKNLSIAPLVLVYMLLQLLTSPQQWPLRAASLVTYPMELSSEGRVGQLAPVKFHHILIHEIAALFLASPDQAPIRQQQN